VFECLPLTDEVRALVEGGASSAAIRDAAVDAGMSTLHDEAVGLCLDGVTTSSEVRLVALD
jgi:type II secretory ATPase GspE/PulE/Tfp pilus assembly ATPase PilB-like protein